MLFASRKQQVQRLMLLLDGRHYESCLCTSHLMDGNDVCCPDCKAAGCSDPSPHRSHCNITGEPMPWDHGWLSNQLCAVCIQSSSDGGT